MRVEIFYQNGRMKSYEYTYMLLTDTTHKDVKCLSMGNTKTVKSRIPFIREIVTKDSPGFEVVKTAYINFDKTTLIEFKEAEELL